jgi:predicted nucleic acid-binding protein
LEVGEAEAIALARQLSATWFLTDDATARVFAIALGLEVHGSLGIVLWAAARGYLRGEDAAAALDRLFA